MKNVFVYGSCVSRDLTALFPSELECSEYIARQGWISSTSIPREPLGSSALGSPFQQRMLDGDLSSTALPALVNALQESDLILLDIIDDRFGVYPLGEGYVTPSAEFGASGIRGQLPLGSHIPFGSDEHFALWTKSALKIRHAIGELNWKVFLLGAPFTERSVDNSEVNRALEKTASTWNGLYERYYAQARALGFQVLTLPDAFAVTTPHHKWGSAPFHYVEASYGWWFHLITDLLAQHREHRADFKEK